MQVSVLPRDFNPSSTSYTTDLHRHYGDVRSRLRQGRPRAPAFVPAEAKPPEPVIVPPVEAAPPSALDLGRCTSRDVVRAVEAAFSLEPGTVTGPRRLTTHVVPRQVAMMLMRSMLRMTFPEIGRRCGGRDHSTVYHAFHKIGRWSDPASSEYQSDLAGRIASVKSSLIARFPSLGPPG